MNKLIKSNLLVLIISNTTNLFNYLLQVFLAHSLSTQDFGIYNSVNSLGLIASSLVNVLMFLGAKYIIHFQSSFPRQCALIRLLTKTILVWGTLLCLIMTAFSGSLAKYLKLDETAPILLFIGWFYTFCFIGIYMGILNGFLQYVKTTFQNSCQNLLRLLFSIIAVMLIGWSYNGVLFAGILANIVTVFWMVTAIRKKINVFQITPGVLPEKTHYEMLKYALPVALNWIAISILSNMDIVLVKHFLTASETGLYSVASLLAKIALFLPMMMLSVLFPEVAKLHEKRESPLKTIMITMSLSVAVTGAYTLMVYLFPELIVGMLFGETYLGASGVLVIITLAMSLLSLNFVIFSAFLAKSVFSFLLPTYAVIALTVMAVYLKFNHSFEEIAMAMLMGSAILLVVNFLIITRYIVFGYRKALTRNGLRKYHGS
ncbi:MAG: oligosaccharide flippase family protein [Desulfobacterales bacterium]|nr:oligosaccharide flippase family protein [Desulfobacterales bacterium]